MKNPEAYSITIEQLCSALSLPLFEETYEIPVLNDGVLLVYKTAIEEGLSEEEAERLVAMAELAEENEYLRKWKSAVEAIAQRYAGFHGLELEFSPDGTVVVYPAVSWREAAERLRATINGVGFFHFSSVEEMIESGPYPSEMELVKEHLSSFKDYGRVYGLLSPSQMLFATIDRQ